jgi:hypothetical protein
MLVSSVGASCYVRHFINIELSAADKAWLADFSLSTGMGTLHRDSLQ